MYIQLYNSVSFKGFNQPRTRNLTNPTYDSPNRTVCKRFSEKHYRYNIPIPKIKKIHDIVLKSIEKSMIRVILCTTYLRYWKALFND